MSLALPLSVGTASGCEILDYALDTPCGPDELRQRLNAALPSGIRVLEVYESPRKLKELVYLHAAVTLEYDGGVPAGAEEALTALFAREHCPWRRRPRRA